MQVSEGRAQVFKDVDEIKTMLQAQSATNTEPRLSLTDFQVLIPNERKAIEDQIKKLEQELDIVSKFNTDFNANLYDGIDIDQDTQKLKTYVGYFSEFRDTIKREQNHIEHEVVQMKDQLSDLKGLLEVLNSLDTQSKSILKLQGSKKQDVGAKAEITKQTDLLHSEYKMFVSKKLRIQDTIERQKSKYLGLAANADMQHKFGANDDFASATSSLKNYSKLAEDYGHRRYVRKAAGRIHGRRVY